jgi:hypothetical protein
MPSRIRRILRRTLHLALVPAAIAATACGAPRAQLADGGTLAWLSSADSLGLPDGVPVELVRSFRSRADSLEWESARRAAERARGYRVVVSLFDRRLWAIFDDDTLRAAPVGVGMDSLLVHGEKRWYFETPRGQRVVRAKEATPLWTPPDWHYVEVAARHGLGVERLLRDRPVRLGDGTQLVVRDSLVGLIYQGDPTFYPMPTDEEIVFDSTLYIPPIGTRHRRIPDILGAYALDLGDGYLLHGTPFKESIGAASTHGCIRLRDDDIEWLYEFVPAGTRVYIY